MQKHIKNYLNHHGYTGFEFIACEVCGCKAVDIHHIEFRSKFGKNKKDEQDHHSNLIALCRICHDKAHNDKDFNQSLKNKKGANN
jgi:hypothetical protein